MTSYEYKTDAQSNLNWGESFNMTRKAPAIAKRIYATYEDALSFANDVSATGTAVNGLIITVTDDENEEKNGAYRIVNVATSVGSNDAELERLGGSINCGDWND